MITDETNSQHHKPQSYQRENRVIPRNKTILVQIDITVQKELVDEHME